MSSFKQVEASTDDAADLPTAGGESSEAAKRVRRHRGSGKKAAREGKAKTSGAADAEGSNAKPARKKRKRARRRKENDGGASQDQSTEHTSTREERKAARKAARKLKKNQARAEKAGKEGQPPEEGAAELDPVLKRERRRRGKKRGPETESPADESADDLNEDALADEEEPALSPEEVDDASGRRRRRDRLASPLATTVIADSGPVAQRFFAHLQKQFGDAGIELISAARAPGLVVRFSSAETPTAAGGRNPIVVVVGEMNSGETTTAAKLAKEQPALIVSMASLDRRFGPQPLFDAHRNLADEGLIAIASDVRDAVLVAETGSLAAPATPRIQFPDLSEAVALAANTAGLLQVLSWPASSPPVSIRAAMDGRSIEAFLDGKVSVRDGGTTRLLTLPLGKEIGIESRRAVEALYGLDFLSSVLGYWFQKANKASSKRLLQIDALVKERGATASSLLMRAGQTLLEFLEQSGALPEAAWKVQVAMRRARALELYLLCCRAAAQRRIKFDERSSAPVFRALVDILERLRPAAASALGTGQGVARAAHVAGLALPLRQTPFGANLLKDVLDALEVQLERGLFDDGVWQEGFSQHAGVFDILKSLSADLRIVGMSSRAFAGLATKMAAFICEYLRDDAYSPAVAGVAPAKYRSALTGAKAMLRSRRAISGATAASGARPASLFPQAGVFTSRSPAAKGAPSSHFVLRAGPPSSGGPSLSFSMGASQLLIGGGTIDRKASAEVRRANLREPAAHNAIRVNGLPYKNVGNVDPPAVAIAAIWDEKNWAAARMVNRAFMPVAMARTVIHLKPLHALLVVDELFADGDAAKFEQYWHLAPGLEVREETPQRLFFAVPDTSKGGLAVVFDAATPAALITAGADAVGWTSTGKREVGRNPYLVRRVMTKKAVLGAFFRFSGKASSQTLTLTPAGQGWKAVMSGEGGQLGFVSENGQLKPAS